ERGARRSDSGIDVRLPATGDIGQLFAGGRVLGRKGLAALRLAPFAADQHLADFAAPALAEGFEAGLDRGLGIHDGLSTTFGGLLSVRSRRIKIVSDTYHTRHNSPSPAGRGYITISPPRRGGVH